MKRIYLARHGQTEGNRLFKFVPKTEPLNSTGHKQAEILAQRVENLVVDKLYVSDFTRAQQTIDPIAQQKDLEPEISVLFGECEFPEYLLDLEYNSEVASRSRELFLSHLTNENWDHEKEAESLFDLMQRNNAARELLESAEFESCLVVSHSYFLKSFIATMLMKTQSPTNEWLSIIDTLSIKNAGISHLQYDKNTGWQLIMLNDHAHFAE